MCAVASARVLCIRAPRAPWLVTDWPAHLGPPKGPELMAEIARPTTDFRRLADFIWDIANLLRGDYKQADYGKVILPMTVLRRLDCVLEPTKEVVLERASELKRESEELRHQALKRTAKQAFYNTSKFDFQRLLDDPGQIGPNLIHYLHGFSN
jgi:type I restriction enzyme M protein